MSESRVGRMISSAAEFLIKHQGNIGHRPPPIGFVRLGPDPILPHSDMRVTDVPTVASRFRPKIVTTSGPGPAWDKSFVPLTSAYEPAGEPGDPADRPAQTVAPLDRTKPAQPGVDLRGTDAGDATLELDQSPQAVKARESTAARVGQPIETVREEAAARVVLEGGVRKILHRYIPGIQARTHHAFGKKNADRPGQPSPLGTRERSGLFGRDKKIRWFNDREEGITLGTMLKPGATKHDFELTTHALMQDADLPMGTFSLQHEEGKKTVAKLHWEPDSEHLRGLLQRYPELVKLISFAQTLAPSEDTVSHQEITVSIFEPTPPSDRYPKGTVFSVVVQASQVDKKKDEESELEKQLSKERSATNPISILAAMDVSGWSLSGITQEIITKQRRLNTMRDARYHTVTYRLLPGKNDEVAFVGATANTSAAADPIAVEVVTDDILAGLFSLIPTNLETSADELSEPVTLLAFPMQKLGADPEPTKNPDQDEPK